MQRTGNYLDKVIINKYALSVTLTAWENKQPIPDNTKSSLMSMSLSHSIKLILTKWLHTIPQKFVKLIVKLFYTMIETDPGLNLLGTHYVIWKYSNLFNKKVSCMQNKEDNKYYWVAQCIHFQITWCLCMFYLSESISWTLCLSYSREMLQV